MVSTCPVNLPERRLHNGPVGHPAIAGAAVEVLVAVKVVGGPVDLPLKDSHNSNSNDNRLAFRK